MSAPTSERMSVVKPLLVVEHSADAGLDLLAAHFDASVPSGPGVEVVRPYLGDRVPGASGYGGLVVLGGATGAWDDDVAPWLPATRRLLADAVRSELPTLGICLGAQLLAAACGGTVERGGAGLEFGLAAVTPLPAARDDPFFGRIGSAAGAGSAGRPVNQQLTWQVNQYHRDAVTRLPADAELLVTGRQYPHQGFRVGAAAWGVQYHPEVSTEGFADWVASGQRIGELPDDAGSVLEAVRAGATTQLRLAAAHGGAFLDVVGVGLPESTAADG